MRIKLSVTVASLFCSTLTVYLWQKWSKNEARLYWKAGWN
jgi:hypothetical protein